MIEINELYKGYEMMIGEDQDYKKIPGLKQSANFHTSYHEPQKKKRMISKFFSNMSRLGMNYEEDVINNLRAIPADSNLISKQNQLSNQNLFSSMASSWKVKQNQDRSFFEKDFAQKREALRKLALQPELEDILDTMSNEAIVYDSDYTYFVEPFIEDQELHDFKPEIRKEITNVMSTSFRRFYKMLNWKYRAWDDFKRWLVEGVLAYEIVYDSLEKPTKIIGIIDLDPATLTRKFENGKWYWYQFKGVQGKERKLMDSQVIYVPYQETNCISRLSYLERLIRPFNIYRIVEQAQLIWTITNASYKMKFTIPVKGMNKTMGMQTLASAMNKYKEDIKFIQDSGELDFNGQANIPFNKEYWLPESESGSPQIETLGGEGPDLNDNDQLKFFKNQLYKISKIPLNRFDQESGETWFGTDASSVARTEIDFGRFVTRLRNQFGQIIIKPLQLQLALSIPELQDNRQLLEAVSLQYKSYNIFEESLEVSLMKERIEFIQEMKDSMVDMDAEGNDVKFFASEFLVRKYLKLSDADLELNAKLKQEENERMNLAGDAENTPDEHLETTCDIITEMSDDDIKKLLGMLLERLDKPKPKKSKQKSKKSEEE
ncbi:MAG: portal protein [Parabacteroides sp.]|nr:portal protein [Parabacteroides sp.]